MLVWFSSKHDGWEEIRGRAGPCSQALLVFNDLKTSYHPLWTSVEMPFV